MLWEGGKDARRVCGGGGRQAKLSLRSWTLDRIISLSHIQTSYKQLQFSSHSIICSFGSLDLSPAAMTIPAPYAADGSHRVTPGHPARRASHDHKVHDVHARHSRLLEQQ